MQSFLRWVAGHPVVRPQVFVVVVGCLLLHLLSSRKAPGQSHSRKTCRPKTWRLGTMVWASLLVVGDGARWP
jgi:hypothetical protein